MCMEPPLLEPHQHCRKRDFAAFSEDAEFYEECLNGGSPAKPSSSYEGAFSELFCKDDEEAENLDPLNEELISGVMKSLADEIMCPCPPASDLAASSVEGAPKDNCYNASSSNVDFEYLLGATDDELGIPPSPNSIFLSDKEAVNCNGAFSENPVSDLFENVRPDYEAEGFVQLYSSDYWYATEEDDISLLNDAVCQEWLARSFNGGEVVNESSSSSSMDQTMMPALEAGVRM